MAKCKLIFALDTDNDQRIHSLLGDLTQVVSWVKIGFQAFSVLGPDCFNKDLKKLKYDGFLDLKFHDIPNTVARDVGTMTKRGAHMINMHASGGFDMMHAARESADRSAAEMEIPPPILLGVTILTSMEEPYFDKYFASRRRLTEQVVYFAQEAQDAGLDGVCASPKEIEPIRKVCGDDFVIVTPGIRPEWAAPDDQRRFTTPKKAVQLGADYIVVGRPILDAPHPVEAAKKILQEIDEAHL